MNKKIYYSKLYPKLSNIYHTTIRKHNKWNIGEILSEYPKGNYLQDVMILKKERKTLLEIEETVLLKDTDEETVMDALNGFNLMRQKIDERYKRDFIPYDFKHDKFTIYYLKIINPKKITDYL